MKKIHYSKDVDALLIELSDGDIAYTEDDGKVILHYGEDNKLVLIEILDFTQTMEAEDLSGILQATDSRSEDAEDVADAKFALAEPGFITLAEVKKELG
jgi:uncharacterized protein YuzE